MKPKLVLLLLLAAAVPACEDDLPETPIAPANVDAGPGAGLDAKAEAGAGAPADASDDRAADAASDAGGADHVVADAANVECMPLTHPGTITFVNETTGVVTVEKLEDVPPESRWWRMTSTGRVPVVKSVYLKGAGGRAEITLYGPCGQFLEHILGL